MSKLMTNPTPGTNKAAEDRLASSCDSQAAQLEDTPSPVDRVSGTGAAPHRVGEFKGQRAELSPATQQRTTNRTERRRALTGRQCWSTGSSTSRTPKSCTRI